MLITIPQKKSKVEIELYEGQQAMLQKLSEQLGVSKSEAAGLAINVLSEAVNQIASGHPSHRVATVKIKFVPSTGPHIVFSDDRTVDVQLSRLRRVSTPK
jgi:hypothetical protein